MCVKGNQTAKSDYKFGVTTPTNLEILDSVSTHHVLQSSVLEN